MKDGIAENLERRETARRGPLAGGQAGFLLRAVDLALAGAIFLLPMAMGGRHPAGELTLTVLAATAASAWAAHRALQGGFRLRPTWPAIVFLASVALVLLQMVPLPQGILRVVSPRAAEIAPLWEPGSACGSQGGWSTISLMPAETRGSLVMLLSYGALFFVASQRVRRLEDIERLLRYCAASAVVMAVFALVQLLAGNDKFFWFYRHPFADPSQAAHGTFPNRNHLAGFLALGIGPLIWWLQDACRRIREESRRLVPWSGASLINQEMKAYLLVLGLGTVLFAGLLSLSRAGTIAMGLAAAVCVGLGCREPGVWRRLAGGLAAVAVLIGLSLAIFGHDRVGDRLAQIVGGSWQELDPQGGRLDIWRATARAASHYPAAGIGMGAFQAVYPAYFQPKEDDNLDSIHPESSCLQVLLEGGLPGLALALGGMAMCGVWIYRGLGRDVPARCRACCGAIAGSLAALAAHGLVDVVWHVPACMATATLLAAAGRRAGELARPAQDAARVAGSSWVLGMAGVLATWVGGAWMIADRIGPALAQPAWDRYQLATVSDELPSAQSLRERAAHRGTSSPAVQREWIGWLEEVVRRQPDHALAQLRLAECYLRLFEGTREQSPNPMSLEDLRDAALQSPYGSAEALHAWLARACGEERVVWLDRALAHTRRALALCPLQGMAYVYLGELGFLQGQDASFVQTCLDRAVAVRPYVGEVLYAAAQEALRKRELQKWLGGTARAFHSGRVQQRTIIADMVGNAPAGSFQEVIDLILERFQPDLKALEFLEAFCGEGHTAEQMRGLRRAYARLAETEAMAAGGERARSLWGRAQRLYAQAFEPAKALSCARSASQRFPDDCEVQCDLIGCLVEAGSLAEARWELERCRQQWPDDRALRALGEEIDGRQAERERRTAARDGDRR
jgi:tetratricopeptide (TPR) repeat protein